MATAVVSTADRKMKPLMMTLIHESAKNCKVKKPPKNQKVFKQLLGQICILEGGIANGKTSAGKLMKGAMKSEDVDLPAKLCVEDICEDMTEYFYKEADAVQHKEKEHNDAAFPMQIQVLERRKANYRKLELAAGRNKKYGGPLRFAIGDRLAWGDLVFAIVNYLMGGISWDQLQVYFAALRSVEVMVDCILFLDVTVHEAQRRKNARAKLPGGRKIERTIPDSYMHMLRLGNYMMLQAVAAEGLVPIQLLRNDRNYSGKELLMKVIECPTAEHTKELWTQSTQLDETCSMAQLDEAYERMHQLYFGLDLKAST
jgi:thymidylate kinase